MGFWALNVDTIVVSALLGWLMVRFFRKVAENATAGVPGTAQNFVEWLVDFVDENVRGSFTGKNPMVAPLALTIFVWIFMMNVMDLIPVDLLPWLLGADVCGDPAFFRGSSPPPIPTPPSPWRSSCSLWCCTTASR